MSNSVDPDQTPKNVAFDLGLSLFVQACLSQYLGLLQ